MRHFVAELIFDLNSIEPSQIQESILQISFVFEKHRGVGKNYTIERQIESLGWSREVSSNDFNSSEIISLKSAITDYIESEPAKDYVAGALSALSALMDPMTKPIFIASIQRFAETDKIALYQAMIGLDNIGEDIFDGNKSKSFTEADKNTQLANQYLERQKLI